MTSLKVIGQAGCQTNYLKAGVFSGFGNCAVFANGKECSGFGDGHALVNAFDMFIK
jgi:hypothetical protein